MPPHSAAMGDISEAINFLCQIPNSPSKLIPDWQQCQFPGQRGQSWAPNTSVANTLDLSGQLKTSGAGVPFLNYSEIQADLRGTMDPMGPMDQGTVLGHGSYSGELSPGHQPHKQLPQQPQQVGLDMAATMRAMEGMSPQAPDELMDYVEHPNLPMGIGASGITSYKQPKRGLIAEVGTVCWHVLSYIDRYPDLQLSEQRPFFSKTYVSCVTSISQPQSTHWKWILGIFCMQMNVVPHFKKVLTNLLTVVLEHQFNALQRCILNEF